MTQQPSKTRATAKIEKTRQVLQKNFIAWSILTLGFVFLIKTIKTRTKTSGPGPGAHAAIKSLGKEGFKIISLIDVTKIARGGPKKKGGKRGRRV